MFDWRRGFTAAVLSQTALGIEGRHPRLVRAASVPLSLLLRAPPIARRSVEVGFASLPLNHGLSARFLGCMSSG